MANIIQVIKYEGDNNTFIWKHPTEDFTIGSQLIVHETQEAVLFKDGQALDSFGPGRHTLTSMNLPILGKLVNIPFDGESPFHCEIYFINKTEQMAIKWGTDTKMEYIEPTYNFPIQLGACGEMNVRLNEGRKLLVRVLGTENSFTREDLVQKFRSFLMIYLKPYIVSLIKENKISVFEIDEYLQSMSVAMHKLLTPIFDDYGLALEKFFITSVIKPEDDKSYRRFKEIHFRQYADVAEAKLRQQVGLIDQQTAAQRMVIEAQGIAQKRSIEGYTYQTERGFDVAERVGANQGVGQFTNMGIGMGMISGIGGTVGSKVGAMLQNAMGQSDGATGQEAATTLKCASCGAALQDGMKFCPSCGEKVVAETPATVICPKCGATVFKAKFCSECGAALQNPVCPKCGKEVAAGAKFCPECGEKLS